MIFQDRFDAGRQLAIALQAYRARPKILVLGLPRGGVPVAYEVASALQAPLDVFVVRKLGVPGHEELAMGAIASGAPPYLDKYLIDRLQISTEAIEEAVARETRELQRRETAYRDHRPRLDPCGQTVMLIDDGVATGSTLQAGILALRRQKPARIVVAVPVAPQDTADKLASLADDFVALWMPENFMAVGQWYVDFGQTSDEQVRELLQAASDQLRAASRE